MAFTYNSNLAAVRDQLRFLSQDTVDAGHFLEDSEIDFVVTQEANIYRGAATLCRTIAARVLRDPGFDNNELDYDPEEKAKYYLDLAKSYEKKAEDAGSVTIDPDAFTANILDVDGCPSYGPAFTRAMHLED